VAPLLLGPGPQALLLGNPPGGNWKPVGAVATTGGGAEEGWLMPSRPFLVRPGLWWL